MTCRRRRASISGRVNPNPVIAGLDPAIPIRKARRCHLNRDHRVTPLDCYRNLRGGPVMTKKDYCATLCGRSGGNGTDSRWPIGSASAACCFASIDSTSGTRCETTTS